MKKIIITTSSLLISCILFAQIDSLKLIRNELLKINEVFDSSIYLGFNVNIVYSSDTVYGKFDHEEMSGNYILNKRNIYYKMGNVEYAQNDSFVYNIYHNEKMLVMTKDILSSNSSIFPLKEFVDSIITWYDSVYTITLRDEEDSKVIEFNASISGLPYNRFAIYYEETSHYPDKFEMSFYDGLNNLPEAPDSIIQLIRLKTVQKKIVMSFYNYYNPQTLEVFSDKNYVQFDRVRRKYRPSEKFKAYRFITNGVDGDVYDESFVLYPPPDVDN
jgi:hypothetical protein